MNKLDTINSMFEAVGAVAAWANIQKIRRDKNVSGVYWPLTAIWSAWGYWNLYYYSSLGHWFSTAAGAVLAVGNTIWVLYAAHYYDKANTVESK